MKQVIQNYRTGELKVYDIPPPLCHPEGVLVRTTYSLISAGTEKMIMEIAKKSLVGKAKARPDLVKEVIRKIKIEGVKSTLQKVSAKLETPIPLGYSCTGTVIKVGEKVKDIAVGDRVACGGAGYATHAEINYVPKNLTVKVPDNVDDISASFVTLGAIALQGVRQAKVEIGESVAVIGLGLIGQLTVQILKASGCRVAGIDIDEWKLEIAKEKSGADIVCLSGNSTNELMEFTQGHGFDNIIITASSNSNQPIELAGELARMRGNIVIVGMTKMDIPRNVYYKKELKITMSMAYGPGRYDPLYEEKGIDYPYSLVRWTVRRNFEAFLNLISAGKILPHKLVTHTFNIDEAENAYKLIENATEQYLAVLFKYDSTKEVKEKKTIYLKTPEPYSKDKINIGVIGAGNFAKSIILPAISKMKEVNLKGLATTRGASALSTGKNHGFEFITTDPMEILKNKDIDAVIIATRHDSHAAMVIEAIRNKKHCFVEKPLSIKEDELEKIRKVYKGDTILMVGFNRRFSSLTGKAKSEVKGKRLSIVYRINAGIIPQDSWIQDIETGGGRIIGEVCHFVDLCSYIADSYVKSVYATTVKTREYHIPQEDNTIITLNFENGSIASINYFAYGDKSLEKEFMEIFTSGTVIQIKDFKEITVYKNGKKYKKKSLSQDKGFQEELRAFINGIKKGKNPIDINSIYNTTLTTFKIIESIKTNSVVKLQ